jgi:acyl-CoA synthetase (AMP-forming)/AMP-acid ligase II
MWNRFKRISKLYPNEIAVSDESEAITFNALVERAEIISNLFSKMDQCLVMVALSSGVQYTLLQLALFKTKNAIFVSIPDNCTESEAKSYLNLVKPDIVIVQSTSKQQSVITALNEEHVIILEFQQLEQFKFGEFYKMKKDFLEFIFFKNSIQIPNGTRQVQFTSGSTGFPKGILISEKNLINNLEVNHQYLSSFEGSSIFCSVPQFHAMGNAVVMEHVWNGSPVHFSNTFLPGDHISIIKKYECRAIYGSPNYFKLMLNLGALTSKNVSSLRSFTIGTAFSDYNIVAGLLSNFPGSEITIRYGLSESVGALMNYRILNVENYLPGCVGLPVKGVQLNSDFFATVNQDAEIIIKTDSNAEYQITQSHGVSQLTDENGFLHTGDIGALKDNGMVVLSGRKDSFLKVNGYKVSPAEIERVLKNVNGIQEVAVVGIPDNLNGHTIIAFLEPIDELNIPNEKYLEQVCRQTLSRHKVPKKFIILSIMPRTKSGKPDYTKILKEVLI